ncbi:hypothetical protein, partial [Staphylococcus microti]
MLIKSLITEFQKFGYHSDFTPFFIFIFILYLVITLFDTNKIIKGIKKSDVYLKSFIFILVTILMTIFILALNYIIWLKIPKDKEIMFIYFYLFLFVLSSILFLVFSLIFSSYEKSKVFYNLTQKSKFDYNTSKEIAKKEYDIIKTISLK